MNDDLICISHLRWDFVHQRPQHLMIRAARNRRVFFVEEPKFVATDKPALAIRETPSSVRVAVPMLPERMTPLEATHAQSHLLRDLVSDWELDRYVLWLCTPMATTIIHRMHPTALVYDCVDELTGFQGAPPELAAREAALLRQADVVFTGGPSLHRAKRHSHHNIHCFPNSVDYDHFSVARSPLADPPSQAEIPHPRVGYFGVIDERMDLDLLGRVADLRPSLQFVMIGPVVKIDPATLPQRTNIHWLGGRAYDELPSYVASWEVAMLPFANNEATRYISPTTVPEYLSAGRPVVSTAIRDVMHPYGVQGLARIAERPEGFVEALDEALAEPLEARWPAADRLLRRMSWDQTWSVMDQLTASAAEQRRRGELVPAAMPRRPRVSTALTAAAGSSAS